MTVLLTAIIALGTVLLFVTAYMEWVGVMNLFTTRQGPRYRACQHLRTIPTRRQEHCYRCRHTAIDHVLHGLGHR
jgi:hypothetical protein